MPPGTNILVWFRADLRVADNTALHRASIDAAATGGKVMGVFLLAPEQWRLHDWAGVKVDFILRHLRALSSELGARNIPLIVERAPLFADAPRAIVRLARGHGCGSVYFNREYEINERRRDQAVTDACAKDGVRAHGFTDQCLVEPGEVRTGTGTYFTVFTPFKRALYKAIEDRGGVTVLEPPAKQASTGVEPSPIPESIAGFSSHVPEAAKLWPAGEKAAHRRLEAFVEQGIDQYKDRRDSPAWDGTSTLSPYLTVGSISPRQCVAAALARNGGKLDGPKAGPSTWISEVAWREFYRHVVVGSPRVCMGRAFKRETEQIRWSDDDAHFRAWCEGRTGFPIVDAGIRQLAATGWMHNRVRMIVAMFLTKDLLIDWRRGERFFMQHLIDGDLASNNGGWQWSASTGTDAAPYFRIFNPTSQSRTCDTDGVYIRRWVPELGALPGGEDGAIHHPCTLPPLQRSTLDYPEPIGDHAKARERAIAAFKAL